MTGPLGPKKPFAPLRRRRAMFLGSTDIGSSITFAIYLVVTLDAELANRCGSAGTPGLGRGTSAQCGEAS